MMEMFPSLLPKPVRANAVERWDTHKITKLAAASPALSSSSGSSQRSPDGKSSNSSNRVSSSKRWDSNKRAISRASSAAARWDAQKKPRPMQAEEVDDCNSSTGSNDDDMDLDKPQQQQQQAFYAGSAASPEPSMLPFPAAFMVRAAA